MKKEKHDALIGLAAALMGDPIVEGAKNNLRDALTRDPMESALMAVLVGSYFFYHAEKGQNPKVNTLGDALVFVSTSLSVGYSDIFPRTEKGKLIATALQTFGPAISSQVLDPPKAKEPAPALPAPDAMPNDSHPDGREMLKNQREILSTLGQILDELKAARADGRAP